MDHRSTPLIPEPRRGLRDRVVRACATAAVRASLLVSPRPAALMVRRVFAAGGASTARGLRPHVPAGVEERLDERYGAGLDERFDLFRPAAAPAGEALPVVVWVHGGGWLGGSKEELAGYLKVIAARGYAVVGLRYSLAPEHRYPTPVRQVMQALRHLDADAERLGLDASRIVMGGDSAGAQLTAQVAALLTTPGYAETVGATPTIAPERLRGVVLACGPYDLALLDRAGDNATARRLVKAILWAYSGHRHYAQDRGFATASVVDHLGRAFPPALVTVGNADPLRAHSEVLVKRLRALGHEPEALFFAPEYRPALAHEYQFDLDTEAGEEFLERLLAFLARRLGTGLGGDARVDGA